MRVLLKKTSSKDATNVGLFPVGFEVTGILVLEDGVECEPSQVVQGHGIYLRVANTAFGDRLYQFATDPVVTIAPAQTHWVVETLKGLWTLESVA